MPAARMFEINLFIVQVQYMDKNCSILEYTFTPYTMCVENTKALLTNSTVVQVGANSTVATVQYLSCCRLIYFKTHMFVDSARIPVGQYVFE